MDEILRSDSANTKARYNRAVCLQNLNRWRDAVADYSEVIRSTPKDSRALYNRATSYMNLAMLPEALADLSAVIEISPSRDAYLNRAKARTALGDAAGARDDERKALQLEGQR